MSIPDILVEAKKVQKDFPSQNGATLTILSSVDCRIREGERIALLGPSGSGKSTLVHLLGGLALPTQGEIVWPALGSRETLRPEKVTFVFQAPSLFPALTIVQNVMLPLILAGNEPEARDRAMYFLAVLGLDSLAQRLPDELSGGQAQRAAMARALIVRPRLILADEPTGQLDSITSATFLDTVLRLIDETGSALLIATHDPAVARRMSGTWTIEHGRLGPDPAPIE